MIEAGKTSASVKLMFLRELLHGYCGMAKGISYFEEGNSMTIEMIR